LTKGFRTARVWTRRDFPRIEEDRLSEWVYKIDAPGRMLLEGMGPDDELDALVRMTRPLDAADRAELLKTGCSIHTESGVILTVQMRRKDIEAVARLAFVHRIECSRPLHVEPTD
jgi:hypothetical protein